MTGADPACSAKPGPNLSARRKRAHCALTKRLGAVAAAPQQWRDDPQTDDLLSALDSLRIAITIFDASGRLIHANRHLNFIFPTLPPVARLVVSSDLNASYRIAGWRPCSS